ncbi:MAG TPA: ScyD/ScyE family protein [Steroidobacteraceae bacterium]|nr:ScyD/ScyE family protein [Steroidobacteraceae bacterium]
MKTPTGKLGLAVAAAIGLGTMASAQSAETIASGLNNPRGIAFAPNGELYVIEMGNGGPGPCVPSPVFPFPPRCYGPAGALTRIAPDGVPGFERVVTGLPSLGLATGAGEGGAADVSFHGMVAYVQIGWGGDPALRSALGDAGALFGSVLQITPGGRVRPLADIAAHEALFNPGGGAVDTNPYGLLALPGRRVIADAGANALIENLANGSTRTMAVLPPVAPGNRDSVPTSVTEGPDGALYVGQLTGFPFWQGTSSVLRVASDGSTVESYADGFTAVVDLAVTDDGTLYVLEVATGQAPPFPPPNPGLGVGRLVRQCPGAPQEVLLSGLNTPAGVALGPDGAVYLTNNGTSPTNGEVLRLEVAACP